MDVFKSSRFWISIFIMGSLLTLCILGKITGNECIATMTGLLAGFGVAKTTITKASPPTSLLLPLGLILCLMGCSSLKTQVNVAHTSIKTLSQIGLPIFHKVCMSAATDCKSKNITSDKCEAWKKCDSARNIFDKTLDSAEVACTTALTLDSFKKSDDAKTLFNKTVSLVEQATKQLKDYDIIPR